MGVFCVSPTISGCKGTKKFVVIDLRQLKNHKMWRKNHVLCFNTNI